MEERPVGFSIQGSADRRGEGCVWANMELVDFKDYTAIGPRNPLEDWFWYMSGRLASSSIGIPSVVIRILDRKMCKLISELWIYPVWNIAF